MTLPAIRFNVPYVAPATDAYLRESLASGALCGDGPFTRRATAALSALVGGRDTLLTTSCTHALELAWLLLDLRPGDEVIMPSFTFVSTANAVALRGAVPVFVDIRPDTLNLDERLLEAAITPRTRAVCVVHYGGVACAMDAINAIADAHGIDVVEDNAHGLGGTYRGRPLGTLGAIAAQSFHETKNVQCGEGGAVVLRDRAFAERAEIIREKGTNRSRFIRGAVDKYTWVDIGSSYLPSDLLAAVLLAGLEDFDGIQARRQAIWAAYDEALAGWADDRGVRRPTVPDDCEHPAHLYRLVLPQPDQQQALIKHLAAEGIQATFHYLPLHDSTAGQRLGRLGSPCPVTDTVSSSLVRLPLHPGLTPGDVDRVVAAVLSFPGLTVGLRDLASTEGGWLIEPAPLDSARFGLDVARLSVRRGPHDPAALVAALALHPADVLVGRYPAELTWVAPVLAASGRDVLAVGGLVYWESPAGPPDPADGPVGVDVVSAVEAAGGLADGAAGGAGTVEALVDDLVLDTFAGYGTHYRYDPLFDPDAITAGYAEWARRCLTAPGCSVLVLRSAGIPVGLATLAPDGADLDILLAGVRSGHQGRGLYAALLAAARRLAAEQGAPRVVISTQTHNVRVQRAWARAGWRPVDTFETVHLVRAGLLAAHGAGSR